uniref:Uncharacterized protein n=1 Tax=Knipowitschia caucasica TaxID=637954 RepID=A0AAV2LHL3_KNICA
MMRKPGQAVTSPAWPDLASSIPTTATATISTKPNTPRVYRPSQTPHLPLSPERVTPGGAGRLTPEARARSELASPPHRPRQPAGRPRERDPADAVAGEIREKGPARVQSRRHHRHTRPLRPIRPGPGGGHRPREPLPFPGPRAGGGGPPRTGRAPSFRRRRRGGDGAAAPPAAARAQTRFAPQPDRPSP